MADLGRQLFGRPARLLTATWVLSQTEPFIQVEAWRAVQKLPGGEGLYQPDVAQELQRLVDLGMVSSVEGQRGRRTYRRSESPLWGIVGAAADAITAV